MNTYLHTRCGDIQLLVDVCHIHEVSDAPIASSDRALMLSHQNWRDQVIPTLDLPRFFARTEHSARRQLVVETGLSDPAMRYLALQVEAADQLLSFDVAKIQPLDHYPDELTSVFEGVYSQVEGDSACLLVLRFPARWFKTLMKNEVAIA